MDLPFEQTPHAGLDPTSFSDVLRNVRPESLPKVGSVDGLAMPHATTILAVVFEDGVIIAGDRRAIEGFTIADRTIEKVFATDDMSAVAIAGTAGPAIEMTRLFQTELEHYEKVEGERLTLDGKANKLAQLIRAHLPMAMQGLGVVPLFAGFDESKKVGRIFKYDMTGGRYEQTDYATTGSGGKDAKATIKKRYRPDLPRDEAIKVALEGLFDASEEDVATGGPDVLRRIYPNIASITAAGFKEVPDDEIAQIFDDLLAERQGTVYPHTSIPEASEGGTDN